MKYLPVLFLILALASVFMFFVYYARLFRRGNPAADILECVNAGFTYPRRRYPMVRADIFALVIITVIYSVVAFTGLGDRSAPSSFCSFTESGRYVIIELPEGSVISRVSYYAGLHTGNYYLQYSMDGEEYTDEATMTQKYNDIFKWRDAELTEIGKAANFVRIISDARLDMGELVIYDWAGDPISPESLGFDTGAAPLFDEQELLPGRFSYMNSTYFDEIYHARTAYEHIENVNPYEISHPPLGKIILGLGIQLFGLNPFGWRFMGVLFGILMLPFLYVFIKNLFGSTMISVCGTLIFAFDFMHFAQTRIATIDTYGVFFILLMFFFMYRYITAPRDDPFEREWKQTLPLFLSGLCFGLGAASKWTVIYGGAGLAIVWLLFRIARWREMVKTGHGSNHTRELMADIIQCLMFFVVIPCLIYYVSYWYYGTARGMGGISMLSNKEYLNLVLDNQKFMFTYHKGVTDAHSYSSKWYQWIGDVRPILYYLESLPNNMKSSFGSFMNPLVCWGGLFAMFAMGRRVIRYKDTKALFILIGYLSSLVPWMFITRITFAYHYFPCLIFLVLAICHVFNSFRLRDFMGRRKIYLATGLCLALFAVFYPVLTGLAIPRWYSDLLAWIPSSWPF